MGGAGTVSCLQTGHKLTIAAGDLKLYIPLFFVLFCFKSPVYWYYREGLPHPVLCGARDQTYSFMFGRQVLC